MSSQPQQAFVFLVPGGRFSTSSCQDWKRNPDSKTSSRYRVIAPNFSYSAAKSCSPSPAGIEPSKLAKHVTTATQTAGGRGHLSAEFLTVAGTIATAIGVLSVIPITTGFVSHPMIKGARSKEIFTIISSFSYGLLLSRFNLRKADSLKLTVVFSLLMRFICMPALSHAVATAGYAIVKLNGTSTAAAAAAAVVNAPKTVKATAASLSLPAGVLSSLFLLSTTPTGFSPCAAMLSLHIHTTLLAILIALTITLFPIIPLISHAVNVWAHRSAFLNIGAILPPVAPPPNFQKLLLASTLPFLCGMGLTKILPGRSAAVCGFLSLPISWLCSLVLLASAISDVIGGSATGLAGSIGLCSGVALMMLLLSRVLGYGLRLDVRAKRTLMLYLCTQGTVISCGIAPAEFAAAPHIASALVGMIFVAIMGKVWSHVIVKTSTDVIL